MVIPPDIIAEESSGDVMVSEGNTVRLVCRAHGYPEPRVEWRREDGRKIALRPAGQAKNEGWCGGGEGQGRAGFAGLWVNRVLSISLLLIRVFK